MSAESTPTVRVVPVAEADLETVADLVNRAFATYAEIFRGQRTSPSDYLDEVGDEARVILIEDGGRLVATGMVAPAERFDNAEAPVPSGTERPLEGMSIEGSPWFGALYFGLAGVEPEIMNRGLGRMLVAEVERLAREEGFATVALGTVREFGLVDYYERLGYCVVQEEVHPAGHWDFMVPHHYCEMVKQL